jgi:transposase-like protein
MSLRDIEKQVKEMYDAEMSDSLLSRIIDKILPEIRLCTIEIGKSGFHKMVSGLLIHSLSETMKELNLQTV